MKNPTGKNSLLNTIIMNTTIEITPRSNVKNATNAMIIIMSQYIMTITKHMDYNVDEVAVKMTWSVSMHFFVIAN